MRLPGGQRPETRQGHDHYIFQVLDPHFSQKRRMFIQLAGRQEVKLQEDKEKDDADLAKIERSFHTDPRRILVLVQEHGQGDEHGFKTEQESYDGHLRRFAVQHHLVVHPAKIRQAPHRNAHPDEQPEGPAQSASAARRSKRHHRRKAASQYLQEIRQEGSIRGSPKRRRFEQVQPDDGRGEDEELSGHSLLYFRLNFLLEFILGKCLQAFAKGFKPVCPGRYGVINRFRYREMRGAFPAGVAQLN